MIAGQFFWGGILPKITEDYEGSLSPVGNRAIERMSIRELYCETNKSSSCESRFK